MPFFVSVMFSTPRLSVYNMLERIRRSIRKKNKYNNIKPIDPAIGAGLR